MELSPGARIDRYLLVEPLGEGGQGSVWKAVDALDASRTVALKLVPIAQAKPTHLERVRREARALATLEHPSLVRCHGLFEDFNAAVLGLVLELVDGKSLADALQDGRFGPELRWAVLEHVARALGHLHERHIVHRDLKPENIVLAAGFWAAPHDPSGVKLIDFGIAAEEGNPNPLTAYGNVIGTPAYMAPELIDATYFAGGRPTPAVDVFAFGVVAWILLVGGHPTGLSAESTLVDYAREYRKVVTGQRTWLGDAPAFVMQCIEPRPERRLQSGGDVLNAMHGTPTAPDKATVAIGGQKGTLDAQPAPELFRPAPVPPTEEMARRPARNHSTTAAVILGLLGIAGVGVVGVAVVLWLVLAPASDPRSTTTAVPAPSPPRAAPQPSAPSPSPSPAPVRAPENTRLQGCDPAVPLCSCCPGKGCCPSGRDCGGACRESLPLAEPIRVRLAGVANAAMDSDKATDMYTAFPNATGCFRVAGGGQEWTCTRFKTIRGFEPAAEFVDITPGDLVGKGLDVEIRNSGDIVASARAVRTKAPDRSTLCLGLVMNGSFSGSERIKWVSFFLDDPSANTARRCVRAP